MIIVLQLMEIALFLIGAIEQQRVCFRYSRKWRPMRMKKSKILLPVDAKGNPDYDYMENYIHQIKKEKIEKYIEFSNKKLKKLGEKVDIKPLSEIEWKEFFVTDIFGSNIQRGKRLIRENQFDGIAEGKENWKKIIGEFYTPFKETVKKVGP